MRQLWKSFVSVASVSGVIGTFTGLAVVLLHEFRWTRELPLAVTTLVIAFAIGALGNYVAGWIRHAQTAQRVFIAHAHGQERLARALADEFRRRGVRVWRAEERIKPGQNWRIAVEVAIRDADTVVALLARTHSDAVSQEIAAARRYGVRVLPVAAPDSELPQDLADVSVLKLTETDPAAVEKIVNAVRDTAA